MRRTFVAVASLAVLTTAVATGCSSSNKSSNDVDASQARNGGDITVAVNGNVTCFDPHQSAANITIHQARSVFDSLTDESPVDNSIKPWLAESWEINPDATEYTFHLRNDVVFTDGSPLTASVVKNNFDSIVDDIGAAKGYTAFSYLTGYQESRVIDDHTVTVVFSKPNVSFLQASSTISLAIVADSTVHTSLEDRCQGKLIGSGPFSVAEFNGESAVKLVKNPQYQWASELAAHQGPAYLDSVTFRVIPEAGVRAGELRSGKLDIDPWILDEELPRLEQQGVQVLQRRFPGQTITITPNAQRPLLQDERVRRAIGLAIDRDTVVSGVLTKYDLPATSLIASNTPHYAPLDGVRFDRDEAIGLLEEAGWKVGADGIREKDGTKLELVQILSTGTRQTLPVVQLVQQQLLDIGVDLDISQATVAQSAALLQSKDYDLKIGPYHRSDADIARVGYSFDFQNSANRAERGPIDVLLARQNEIVDDQGRTTAVSNALNALIDGGYAYPVFEIADIVAVAQRVHGVSLEASSRLKFYDAWVS